MAEYNIVTPTGYGSVTTFPECLPTYEKLKEMYDAGCVLYKDKKKLALKDAAKELPPVKGKK